MDLDTDTEDTLLSPVERLKGVFDLCDKDKDGLLTVNEFRTLTHQFLGAATQVSQYCNHEQMTVQDTRECIIIDNS